MFTICDAMVMHAHFDSIDLVGIRVFKKNKFAKLTSQHLYNQGFCLEIHRNMGKT